MAFRGHGFPPAFVAGLSCLGGSVSMQLFSLFHLSFSSDLFVPITCLFSIPFFFSPHRSSLVLEISGTSTHLSETSGMLISFVDFYVSGSVL